MENNSSGIPKQEIPKMSDELAGRSDIAALEYGKTNGKEIEQQYSSDYDTGADLTDAHLAGQSWMYRALHSLPPSPIGEAGARADILRARIQERRDCIYLLESSLMDNDPEEQDAFPSDYILCMKDEISNHHAFIASLENQLKNESPNPEVKEEELPPCVCSYAGEATQYCAFPKCDRNSEVKIYDHTTAGTNIAAPEASVSSKVEYTATDKEKVLILKVLQWANDNHVHREIGKYWQKDYSNIAYTDEKIVEEFIKLMTHKTI